MRAQVDEDCWSLTDKEKQTLRLMVRGHDAKSIARCLDLSVHTINERLRAARRKMAVPSSREAARLLFEAEGSTPENLGYDRLGDASDDGATDQGMTPPRGVRRNTRRPLLIGVALMTLILGLLALAAAPDLTRVSTPTPASATNQQVVDAARSFLRLLDDNRWADSYALFGSAFRRLNTEDVWARTSQKVRAPLGPATSRILLRQEYLPAPPAGYEVVKFSTRFADGRETIETVSLDREDGRWVVVGVTLD